MLEQQFLEVIWNSQQVATKLLEAIEIAPCDCQRAFIDGAHLVITCRNEADAKEIYDRQTDLMHQINQHHLFIQMISMRCENRVVYLIPCYCPI